MPPRPISASMIHGPSRTPNMKGAQHGRRKQAIVSAYRLRKRPGSWRGNGSMRTAVLLIAHGSREAEANADLHHVAESLRRRGEAIVVATFLELAEPGIAEGGRLCVQAGADRVVLAPYFLSAGVHVRRD